MNTESKSSYLILTNEHHEHIKSIAKQFEIAMTAKYVKGVAEHGGNLWENTTGYLIDAAISEAIDQVVYLLTLKEKLNHAR